MSYKKLRYFFGFSAVPVQHSGTVRRKIDLLIVLCYNLNMKLWLKYLIGIAIGALTALLIPANTPQSQAVLDFILNIVIRFGRYMLLPLLFFSIATACYKLREEKLIVKTGLWTFIIIIASSAILALLGLFSALIVHLPRIPILMEKTTEVPSIELKDLLLKIFPYSGFQAILEGAYLLPCFIFAGLIGAGAASEKTASKSLFPFFDSFSRVCYNIMTFFSEMLAVGIIAVMSRWTLDFIALQKAKVYMPMVIMLLVDLVIIAVVVYPVIVHFVCHDNKPWRVLYAGICPFLTAFFSGDTNLALPLNMRHGKESLGIRRKCNAVTFPLFSVFGRGGSALVAAVSFVNILRSYSQLEISLGTALWIGGMAFALSFVLCQYSSGGAFVAIAIMCSLYGPSYEAGYLLIRDASPIICAFAAGFDALTAIFGSYIVAVRTKQIEHNDLRHYI